MNHHDPKTEAWLHRWLTTQGIPIAEISIDRLAGDGSNRTFYRLKIPSKTLVLLVDPDWHLSKDYAPHQAYLSTKGVRVPGFLEVDPREGYLIMEDLGDELLQIRIHQDPKNKVKWLRSATELLATLHGETFTVPNHLPV